MGDTWKTQFTELIRILGLAQKPVAVTFTNDPVGPKEPKGMRLCRALKLAAEGKTSVIEPETSACKGGSWHCGLSEPASGDMWRGIQRFLTRGEKLTHSIVTFQRMLDLTTSPPTGFCERIVMGPVEKSEIRPDLILFLCNPEQTCRLITLDQYWDGIPPQLEMAGSLCHSALAYPIVTGRTNVTFGDWTARRMEKYPADTVFVSIPYERIHNLIAAVPECSAGSAKLEIPKELRDQLQVEESD